MSLKITRFVRNNPAPCDHWTIDVTNTISLQVITFAGITRTDLANGVDSPKWWGDVALRWLKWRIAQGDTPVQMTNVEILTASNIDLLLGVS